MSNSRQFPHPLLHISDCLLSVVHNLRTT